MFLFVYFLFTMIQFSNQVNYSYVEKILGGRASGTPMLPPPPQSYTYGGSYKQKQNTAATGHQHSVVHTVIVYKL
jgi:hypothetical protein